jgi:hypothetical protein
MVRCLFLTLIAGILVVGAASAQTSAPRFQWRKDQVLTYLVEHITSASELVDNANVETRAKLNVTKRWQVKEVDSAGVATLQMSLAAMRLETTRPDGQTLVFDSANPDKSTPEMKAELEKFVGPVIAVLRLDARGKLVEVKESKFGPGTQFERELPFLLMLPETAIKEGQGWERGYAITLAPPAGTGEKYSAVQKYSCKAASADSATITLTTAVKDAPSSPLEQIPLLQLQPQGELVFDVKNGMLRSARLSIDKELKGHQGEGSSYRFQSVFTEELVANP